MFIISCGTIDKINHARCKEYLKAAQNVPWKNCDIDELRDSNFPGFPKTMTDPGDIKRYYLLKASELCPQEREAPYAIALTYWDENRLDEAINCMDKVIAKYPNWPKPKIANIEILLFCLGKRQEAISLLKELSNQKWNNESNKERTCSYYSGVISLANNDLPGAELQLKATEMSAAKHDSYVLGDSDEPGFRCYDCHYFLAILYLKKGNQEESLKQLEKYRKIMYETHQGKQYEEVYNRIKIKYPDDLENQLKYLNIIWLGERSHWEENN